MHCSSSIGLLILASVLSVTAVTPASSQTKIPVPGTDRWLVQYADSTVSLNDICPIAKKKLGTGKAPLYVNQRPVGFC